MEFDPLSREAPPPRHQLESDSESDGEGQGPPSSSRPSSLRPTREDGAPRIEHVLDADADAESQTSWKGRPLVVLLGPAGEAWAASHPALENATEDAKVLVDGVQQASISAPSSSSSAGAPIYLFSSLSSSSASASASTPLSTLAPLARHVQSWLAPSQLLILESYSPRLYIRNHEDERADEDEDEDGDGEDPVRYIANEPVEIKGVRPFDVPNSLQGFAAALLSQASYTQTQTLLLLLPSHMPTFNPHLHPLSQPQSQSQSQSQGPSERAAALDLEPEPPALEVGLETIQRVDEVLRKWLGQALPPASASASSTGTGTHTFLSFLRERRDKAHKSRGGGSARGTDSSMYV